MGAAERLQAGSSLPPAPPQAAAALHVGAALHPRPPHAVCPPAGYAMEKKSSIIAIGLTVHNAPVELREKLAVPEAEWPRAIEELCSYPHIEEAAVLSTCNRMEIYVVAVSFHRGELAVMAELWPGCGRSRRRGGQAGGWAGRATARCFASPGCAGMGSTMPADCSWYGAPMPSFNACVNQHL